MKKKSLNQSETIRWLIFSWLPEIITLLYVIIRSIVDSYFLDHFIITALFFSILNNCKSLMLFLRQYI